MKYKVIKEMPGYSMGHEYDAEHINLIVISQLLTIKELLADNWIEPVEEVKEESLEDKFVSNDFELCNYCTDDEIEARKDAKQKVQLAKSHILEVFDKTCESWKQEQVNPRNLFKSIRKAIEDA